MNAAATAMHRRAAHLDFLRATRHRWQGGSVRTSPIAPRGLVVRVTGVCREVTHKALPAHSARH